MTLAITQAVRTALHIAPFGQPDGTRIAKHTIEFRGALPPDEAVRKAEHIIRAQTMNHSDRGYLLNCLTIGNWETEVLA